MKQDISLKTNSTLIRRKKMVTLDDLANFSTLFKANSAKATYPVEHHQKLQSQWPILYS